MEKKCLLLVGLFLFSFCVFGQGFAGFEDEVEDISETSSTVSGPLKQYQTFSWKPVANARGYCVTIEQQKENSNSNSDESYNEVEVVNLDSEKTRYETLLYPGEYRVLIQAVNLFGKKSQASWVPFTILNDTEPFLQDSTFEYKQDQKSLYYSVSPNKIPTSTQEFLTIKGRNIFFPETKFSFVPIANTNKNANSYKRFSSLKNKIPCEVVSRDRETNSVTISVDTLMFETGYYEFTVKNPGGNEYALEVFVKTDVVPEFLEENLAFDRNYSIRVLNFREDDVPLQEDDDTSDIEETEDFSDGEEDSTLKAETQNQHNTEKYYSTVIYGYNFTPDTQLCFEPINYIGYPFESIKEREPFYAKVVTNLGSSLKDIKAASIEIQVTEGTLIAGCYCLKALNENGESKKLEVRINVEYMEEIETSVKKISSSQNAKTQIVTFKLEGILLSPDFSYTAVSHLLKDGTNARLPLQVVDNSRNEEKITLQVDSSEFPEKGLYAIQIETDTDTLLAYCDISGTFKSKMKVLTESDVEKQFLRPADFTYDENGEKWINDLPMGVKDVDAFVESKGYSNTWGWREQFVFEKEIVYDYKKEFQISPRPSWVVNQEKKTLDHITINKKNTDELQSIKITSADSDWSDNHAIAQVEIADEKNIFAKGDTLLIKTNVDRNTSRWDIFLTTEEGLEYQYKPKKKNPKLKKGENIIEIPYSEFESENQLFCTNFRDFEYKSASEIVFPEKDEWSLITFYREYCQAPSTLTINEIKIYDSVRSDKFRPETLYKPVVFTDLGLNLGGSSYMYQAWGKNGLMSSPLTLCIDLTLLRFASWLTLDVSVKIDYMLKNLCAYGSLRLEIPSESFSPYVGAGFGIGIHTAYQFKMLPVYGGVVLFNFLDLKYQCDVVQNDFGTVLYDYYSVGFRFRLRQRRIIKEPLI